MHPYKLLEQEYARYVGTEHAVSVNTGTAALHLALKALGIGPGDEVIVPEFTMIASAWAVTYCGATPVFVDCTDDLLIDVDKIEEKITKKTRVIMPVHIYGRVCNMGRIMEIAKKHSLRVVEDACEAQGAFWGNKAVGSFDIGCFSFYLNKIIPAEEGGMITTSDLNVYTRAQDLKSMAFGTEHNYYHKEIGFNYRMTNSQASFVLENLRIANSLQQVRFKIENWYEENINPKYKMPKRNVVWVYDIRHPNAEKVVRHLNAKGINARHGFKPMSMQPMYSNENYTKLNAYKMSQEVCYLPVSPLMTEDMVKTICKEIDTL